MKPSKILTIAWENMRQRRFRTALTTLSVVIGITAIIGLAALGEGFKLGIRDRMQQGFELDVLVILPIGAAGIRESFAPTEVMNIRNISGVKLVTGMTTFTQSRLLCEDNSTLNAFTVGVANFTEMAQMFPKRLTPIEGEMPARGDDDTIVLGYKTCFVNETSEPLVHVGENVTFRTLQTIPVPPYSVNINKTLRVAAILQQSGSSALTNFDYWAFTPTNPVTNVSENTGFNVILVKVTDPNNSEEIAKSIENVLGNPYSMSIIVPIAFMNQVDQILNFVQIFLMSIASISLLVAGIGIMNIMMVSVMERTREIGILKAVGASSRTVLAMFLGEAVLIGLIGGVIGVFAGYGLSYALAFMISAFMQPQQQTPAFQTPGTFQRIEIVPVFSAEWTVIAVAFSVVICVVFGLYPARKAARLDPVEALHYE